MDYQIVVGRTWRYRDRVRGAQDLVPGTYRVPEDVSDSIARLALEQGMATRREVEKPKPLPRQSVTPSEAVEPKPVEFHPKRKRMSRKKPAPENKIAHVAEDKQTLV